MFGNLNVWIKRWVFIVWNMISVRIGFKFFIHAWMSFVSVFFSSVVIGSDEQERFMAFLVDPLHFGKKFYRLVIAYSESSVFP